MPYPRPRSSSKSTPGTAEEQYRVVVYIPRADYDLLKTKLALEGHTVSWWFRDQARRFLAR